MARRRGGHKQLTSVFLRAAQFALVGGLIGSVLSGVLALPGGDVPFLAAALLAVAARRGSGSRMQAR